MVLFQRIKCYGSPGQLLELLLQFPSKKYEGFAEGVAYQALLNFCCDLAVKGSIA